MTTILSIIALAASCVACTEDGPVTNPRQEEAVAVEKETGFARGADV